MFAAIGDNIFPNEKIPEFLRVRVDVFLDEGDPLYDLYKADPLDESSKARPVVCVFTQVRTDATAEDMTEVLDHILAEMKTALKKSGDVLDVSKISDSIKVAPVHDPKGINVSKLGVGKGRDGLKFLAKATTAKRWTAEDIEEAKAALIGLQVVDSRG